MNPLKDKKVVVIGGSSGMGFAIAKAAAAESAQVVISGRSAKRLEPAPSLISMAAVCWFRKQMVLLRFRKYLVYC